MAHVEDRWYRTVQGERVPSDRYKVGKRYRVRYRGPDRAEHYQSFERKADAERFAASASVTVARGDWTDPRRARVTVAEWSEQWLAAQVHLKPSTEQTYQRLLRLQVLPTWGAFPLASVQHAEITRWVRELHANGLSASRTRQAYRVLSLMLDLAVRDGRLPRNPAAQVQLPRLVKADKQYLTHEQVHALADECGRYRTLILVLGYCGLRWGEAVALRVRSVDLMRGRLNVSEAVTEIAGHLHYGTPKTHQRRSVPVPRSVRDELTVLCAGRAAGELVFTAPRGGPVIYGNFRRTFDPAAVRAGLPGLTPHELRNTAASLAVDSGANVKHVQRMLGHASAAMTLDVYAGLFEDGLDDVADRLDAAAGRALASQPRPEASQTVRALHRAGRPQAL